MQATAETPHVPLLAVEDLAVHFGPPECPVRAVDGVSFTLDAGETLALVGESGCGKSMTALALARLVPQPAGRYAGGRVLHRGRDVLAMRGRELRRLRGGEIAYVFQEPGAALNPVMRVGDQIAEALRLHRPDAAFRAETIRLLQWVGIPDPEARRRAYPHQLSGGMQQRVMIAMALACRPGLLVADEPTTALDVTIQAQIMELLAELQKQLGMALLLITHNLGLVAQVARRVLVMYAGRVVEEGPALDVLRAPAHPYTRGLLAAMPRLRGGTAPSAGIPGQAPAGEAVPAGCPFHPRCPLAQAVCRDQPPPWVAVGEGRRVCCHTPLS